jgi:hypothetical protein
MNLQTIFLSNDDDRLSDLITVDSPVTELQHALCQMMMNQEDREGQPIWGSAEQQYGQFSQSKNETANRNAAIKTVRSKGLVEVLPTESGIDIMVGTQEDLHDSLREIARLSRNEGRNIEAEEAADELQDPALGGDPAVIDQGYHYDIPLSPEELHSQLLFERDRLRKQSWFQSRITEMVVTTDKDAQGRCIEMPWYKWTTTQAWRRLRELEPDETLHGEDEENELYTLRAINDVGLPDDSEVESM